MSIDKVIQNPIDRFEIERHEAFSEIKGHVDLDCCSTLFTDSSKQSTINAIKSYCVLTSLQEQVAEAELPVRRLALQMIYSEAEQSGGGESGIDPEGRYRELFHLLQGSDRSADNRSA